MLFTWLYLLWVTLFQSSVKLFISRTFWLESLHQLFIFIIIRSVSSLIRWGSPEVPLFLSPASLSWVTSTSFSLLLSSHILVKPSWILWPLDVKSEPTKIEILKSLLSFLGTSLTFKLYECIPFLNNLQQLLWDRFYSCHKTWKHPRIIAWWLFSTHYQWRDS